jgi:hypothetical protein
LGWVALNGEPLLHSEAADPTNMKKEGNLSKPISVGDLIAEKYEVLEIIKPGGMGAVYRVRDKATQRQLALKIPSAGSDEELGRLAFDREREALENLRHKHIVELVDVGRLESGESFLALEWLSTDLTSYLRKGQGWGWEDFYADIGRPLLTALALAHTREFAHRDIKPDNLMFDSKGNLKIIDFGIAKAKSSLAFGRTLRQAGSPPYTPPESDDGALPFTRDTYSWCAVAASCLHGSVFKQPHEIHDALGRLSADQYPIAQLSRSLSLDPATRSPSAIDLLYEMEEFHQSVSRSTPIKVVIQIGMKELQELAIAWADRTHDDLLALIESDLNGSLHGYIVDEEQSVLRLVGISLDLSCRPLDRGNGFRIVSVRPIGLDRAEAERRTCSEISGVTVVVIAALTPIANGASSRVLIARLLATQTSRLRDEERKKRERWFDCWTAVLRGKERFQREKRLHVDFRIMTRSGQNYIATCDGEWDFDPAAMGDSLILRTSVGKHLFFSVVDVLFDQIILRLQGNFHDLVPSGPGVLETNHIAQLQPIARQRNSLDAVRRGRAASPILSDLLCDATAAPVPEMVGFPNADDGLNFEKKELIEKALGIQSFMLIEGPPGTGKTTFIAELVRQYVMLFPKNRVLLSSQTHTALDHVINKLRSKNLDHLIVRVHGERMEKIDPAAMPLTLEQKTRGWIEKVEERARDFLAKAAQGLGLKHGELEVAVLGEQRHRLMQEQASLLQRLQLLDPALEVGTKGTSQDAADEDAVIFQTNTLIDERRSIQEALEATDRRKTRLEEQLSAINDYGKELAKASSAESVEWIRALSKTDIDGAAVLKKLIDLQLEWFSRLGATRDFHGAVLGEARIVAGTCVGLGNISAIGEQTFDLCVIDEVSKAAPTETLIPMSRSHKWILVGDSKQLPPFNELKNLKGIDGFEPDEISATLLDILSRQLPAECRGKLREQRRMAGGIGELISEVFYDGELDTIRKERDRSAVVRRVFPNSVEWHSTSKLSSRGDEELAGRTYRNNVEALVVQKLLIQLNSTNRNNVPIHVAVIASYSAQVRALSDRLNAVPGGLQFLNIEVNTVDAFQGRDADVCIYSVTRSNSLGKLGFQREIPRLNVALSRGKDALIIVGDDAFCRRIEKQNPFLKVLAHMDNHAADCCFRSYERL